MINVSVVSISDLEDFPKTELVMYHDQLNRINIKRLVVTVIKQKEILERCKLVISTSLTEYFQCELQTEPEVVIIC